MAPRGDDKPDGSQGRKPCDLPTPKSTASFWHKEPSALLMGHRSTRNLPEHADVVIIGSGMTGTSAAHHILTDYGRAGKLNVVLLEAREACWGATGRNGGHCQPILFEHPHNPEIGHFELNNFHTLQSLINEKNIDCEFVAQPGVRAIYSQSHLDNLQQALVTVKDNAPELASMMRLVTDRQELHRLRIPTAMAAIVTSLAARMWPYKLISRILEDLLTSTSLNGTFNLQTLTPVTGLAKGLTTSDVLVSTDRGRIQAKKVILATNAYTSHLLHGFADLIVPCRGQMSALVPFPSVAGDDRLKTSFGFLGDGLDDYLIQRPTETGGHLMFGGGRQHGPSIGVTDDSTIDEKTGHYLRGRLTEALGLPEGKTGKSKSDSPTTEPTSWKEMDATHIWTGIMGFSRDEKPWIGAVPEHHGVFIAAGFTGHGMPNCFLSGKAVALMTTKSLAGASQTAAVDSAVQEVGLPRSFVISRERMQAALEIEDVGVKDWAEMERGRHAQRPASGYV